MIVRPSQMIVWPSQMVVRARVKCHLLHGQSDLFLGLQRGGLEPLGNDDDDDDDDDDRIEITERRDEELRR